MISGSHRSNLLFVFLTGSLISKQPCPYHKLSIQAHYFLVKDRYTPESESGSVEPLHRRHWTLLHATCVPSGQAIYAPRFPCQAKLQRFFEKDGITDFAPPQIRYQPRQISVSTLLELFLMPLPTILNLNERQTEDSCCIPIQWQLSLLQKMPIFCNKEFLIAISFNKPTEIISD